MATANTPGPWKIRPPNGGRPGELLVRVQRVEVAGDPGERHDVGLGDRAGRAVPGLPDLELVEVHASGRGGLGHAASPGAVGPLSRRGRQTINSTLRLDSWLDRRVRYGRPVPARGASGGSMARICFLNPFGTDSYDDLIGATLRPALHGNTEVEIRHLAHAPRNIDYYAPKHLAETEIMTAALEAEREGFDAFVIGCCYDPALSQCRELVNIPVDRTARGVGPAVAAVRPQLRRRHRPPEGGARAARPCPPLRAGGQLPGRRRHRLVRHGHGARSRDRGEGHLRQGAGRDAHDRRRDRRHRLHDRLGLLRAGRPARATPSSPRCRSSTRT